MRGLLAHSVLMYAPDSALPVGLIEQQCWSRATDSASWCVQLAENEGVKFWLNVLTELKNRGLNDILIARVDGQKGFPDAINTVYPEARIQLCMVHMVRNSQRFISWKDDIVGRFTILYH